MTRAVVVVCLLSAQVVACDGGAPEPLRIGAKPFAEQAILSEAARLLVEDAGIDAEVVECAESYDCHRRLREGSLDLMIEYTGTALQFVGGPRSVREQPVKQVRRLFRPLGLVWLDPLGFDNGYRVLVPQSVGASKRIHSIEDLVPLEGVRIATPSEFLRRSRDGLPALVRRYGLALADEPLVIEDPVERFQALRDGHADVAIGYATDGAIGGLGLQALDDPLGFFPPYEAAIVVRADALRRHDELRGALDKLSGALSEDVMSRLNGAVQIEGRSPATVARRFLQDAALLGERDARRSAAAPIVLGFDAHDGLRPEIATAVRGLRGVFPDRAVQRRGDIDRPLRDLARGRIGFAVVTAEHFFRPPHRGRNAPAEAMALVGNRVLHLLRRAPSAEGPLSGRIGVHVVASSSGRIGRALLALEGGEPAMEGPTEALVETLLRGRLDGVLVLAERGDVTLLRVIEAHRQQLRLVALGPWLSPARAVRLPYLQRVRVPAGTYAGQDEAIETLGVQIVLAGPSPARGPAGAGGPAAALPTTARPLPPAQLARLTEATGILEIPDSVLPSAWTSGRSRLSPEEQDGAASALDTALNLLVAVYLAWLVWLVVRREERSGEETR